MKVLAALLAGVATGLLLSGVLNTPAPALQAAPNSEFNTKVTNNELSELRDFAGKFEMLFRTVAHEVSPAVVLIEAEKVYQEQVPAFQFRNPFFDDFFGSPFGDTDPFMRRRQQPQQPQTRERRARGLGSGSILDEEGHILTNNHVVGGADELHVTLTDGRRFDAKVVGTDEKTDLAVIELVGDDVKDLPTVKLGDSDDLEPGQWVLAIGNPFGLRHTVSTGIISATGRTIGVADYESMIQTDAAINRGNSGGPLVNLYGQVIGINTAIVGQANLGIGFAIPINMAKEILDDLIAGREIVRGYLGVYVGDVTPDKADAFDYEGTKGAFVEDVAEGSPADEAGIEPGDIVMELNGEKIDNANALKQRAAAAKPGAEVELLIWRNGKQKDIKLVTGDLAEAEDWLGIQVASLTREMAKQMGKPDLEGVVITDVAPGSPAGDDLSPGDVILSVDRVKVKSVEQYMELMTKVEPGQRVPLRVLFRRTGRALFVIARRPGKH
jgi:serine protease Do